MRTRKGIILAGGNGTRLAPLTLGVSKQLLPVHDKPMIYYPLSILMRGNIRDVLIITNEGNERAYHSLLGDGSKFGMNIHYACQKEPRGIPEAFLIGKNFIGDDPLSLILGDNLFFGNFSQQYLAALHYELSSIFVCKVKNPAEYGVYDPLRKAIVEKPEEYISSWAVTGLYMYESDVVDIAKDLKPSARGELEITDVNMAYLTSGRLMVQYLPGEVVWLDAGNHESLADAGSMIRTIEARQGYKIACLEEIAWCNSWIDDATLEKIADEYKSSYSNYLKSILQEKKIKLSNLARASIPSEENS